MRVLVVDDHPLIREGLSNLLRQLNPGVAVDEATSVEQAREILALLVQGKPNKLICRALGISDSTVKAHISSVLRILGVDNRTEAVIKLGRLGMRLPAPISSVHDASGSATGR